MIKSSYKLGLGKQLITKEEAIEIALKKHMEKKKNKTKKTYQIRFHISHFGEGFLDIRPRPLPTSWDAPKKNWTGSLNEL